jgi:hypothetical protein
MPAFLADKTSSRAAWLPERCQADGGGQVGSAGPDRIVFATDA